MLEKELRYLRIAGHSVLEAKHVVPFVFEDEIVHLNASFAEVCCDLS
jgi:hypothetical protein